MWNARLGLLFLLIHAGFSMPMEDNKGVEPRGLLPNVELRCQLSESICQLNCFLGGQKTGVCIPKHEGTRACICIQDGLDDAICGIPEKQISGYTCAGYCQISGRQTGECKGNSCQCSEERFDFNYHARCVTNEVCSMYCQFVHKASTGRCQGENMWNCKCEFAQTNSEDVPSS